MPDLTASLCYTDGLIRVNVQDAQTKQVLMFAYANEEAVSLTLSTGYAHYFSRSRNKLWKKGEESGHLQKIVNVFVDCDEDCFMYQVEQTGCACHEGYYNCFFRPVDARVVQPKLKEPAAIYHK